MSPDALTTLKSRIERTLSLVRRQGAEGFVQRHEVDGQQQTYAVEGVKSPEQLQDELLTLFIWVWSLKDYLKEAYVSKSLDPGLVETLVNNSVPLQYVSDIANRAKHGSLNKSRSGAFAELVDVGMTIPSVAMSKVIYLPNAIGVQVGKPEEVQLLATVKPRGAEAIDAFVVLASAMSTWENHAFPQIAA